jgi:hypothetical protein
MVANVTRTSGNTVVYFGFSEVSHVRVAWFSNVLLPLRLAPPVTS